MRVRSASHYATGAAPVSHRIFIAKKCGIFRCAGELYDKRNAQTSGKRERRKFEKCEIEKCLLWSVDSTTEQEKTLFKRSVAEFDKVFVPMLPPL